MSDRRPRPPERPRWITDDVPDKPVRQPLSRRRIILAALALAEKEGIGALSMRRLAAALDVTPMSLYNHVADKAELLDLMLDYVLADVVRASVHDTGTWEERLRAVVHRNYETWRQHSVFARVYVDGVTIGPNGLANMERVVGLLREAGLPDHDAAHAFMALWHLIVGSILVSPVRPVDRSQVQRRGSRNDRVAVFFSALPPREIPNVVAVADHFSGRSFEYGLDLFVVGLHDRLRTIRQEAGLKALHDGS